MFFANKHTKHIKNFKISLITAMCIHIICASDRT